MVLTEQLNNLNLNNQVKQPDACSDYSADSIKVQIYAAKTDHSTEQVVVPKRRFSNAKEERRNSRARQKSQGKTSPPSGSPENGITKDYTSEFVARVRKHSATGSTISTSLDKKIVNHERKSRNGKSIGSVSIKQVAKNGGGGKYTWGQPGCEMAYCPSGADDYYDPNYDDYFEDQDMILDTVGKKYSDNEIQKLVRPLFKEYLANGDDSDLLKEIFKISQDRNSLTRTFYHILLWTLESKQKSHGHSWNLIMKTTSLSEQDGRKELYQFLRAICNALEDFFDSRKELILDYPKYDDFTMKIVGCVLYKWGQDKEQFVRRFIENQKKIRANRFSRVMENAIKLIDRIKDDTQIMHTIWTADDFLSTEQLSLCMAEIIKDWTYDGYSYVSLEQDLTHSVKTPHFYHELVYQLIYFTLTDGSQKCIDAAIETLEYLKKKGLLTDEQTKTGFLRIYKEMDELTLDVPSAHLLLNMLVKRCYSKGLINDEVRVKMPKKQGDRRRVVSEFVI